LTDIVSNIKKLRHEIPEHVRIIAVSKTMPAQSVMEAYNAGHRIFGENRVQELISKKEKLPSDIDWHFIGHLQTNKVRLLLKHTKLIHSVDSLRLLKTINSEASGIGIVTDCLLEFHIALEETKSGFSMDEAKLMLESEEYRRMHNIRICGVMGMATFTDNAEQVRNEFRNLRSYFNFLGDNYFSKDQHFREISMGMSGDYRIAVEEGSTMVRIGSLIFGARTQN
jgi:pyridoxal phosphate enzyme (YggS family)